MTKIKKNFTAGKLLYFNDKKLQFTYPLASTNDKLGSGSTNRVLRASKRKKGREQIALKNQNAYANTSYLRNLTTLSNNHR
jgi:hypothetical protein